MHAERKRFEEKEKRNEEKFIKPMCETDFIPRV